MSENLGERIRARMSLLGLKQADLVRATGVSRPTAWWHGDVSELKSKHVEPLARLLKCRQKWLTEGVGPIDPESVYSKSSTAQEPTTPYAIALEDKNILEALELLKQLNTPDRREALAWIRGFAAGRKRELAKRENPEISHKKLER